MLVSISRTMHPQPCVPVLVTRGDFVAQRYTYVPLAAEPRSTARFLFHIQGLCGTIVLTHVFDYVGLTCCKSRVNAFILA